MSTIKDDLCTDVILDFIAGGVPGNLGGESGGNYNAVIGNAHASDDLGRKTLAQIYALMADLLAMGRPSTAIGRYQIIRKTLQSLQAAEGLSDDALFTPQLQDRLAVSLLVRRGYSMWWLGQIDDEEFAHRLSCEWASLPDPERDGRSHYDGDGINSAGTTLAAVCGMLNRARAAKDAQQPANTASANQISANQISADLPDAVDLKVNEPAPAPSFLDRLMFWRR